MRLPHVIPFARKPIYFFTACTAGRRSLLACKESFDCLQNIWRRSAETDGWIVGRFVLMPDHVHLFASPLPDAKRRDQCLSCGNRFHHGSWPKYSTSTVHFGRPIHLTISCEEPNRFQKSGSTSEQIQYGKIWWTEPKTGRGKESFTPFHFRKRGEGTRPTK
jgi:hypothetical protein